MVVSLSNIIQDRWDILEMIYTAKHRINLTVILSQKRLSETRKSYMIEKAQLIITQKTRWKHRCFTLPANLKLQHKYKHLAHINTLIHQILLAVKH